MTTVLNIVHPYTYKIFGDENIIGPVEEYHERDTKLNQFVQGELARGTRVIAYHLYPRQTVQRLLADVSFRSDHLYSFLFNRLVAEAILPVNGIPIPNRNNGKIPEEVWRKISKMYTKKSQLTKLISDGNPVLFIGGALENCVTNFACYWADQIRNSTQQGYILPELCASFNSKLFGEKKPELEKRGIRLISLDEANEVLERVA